MQCTFFVGIDVSKSWIDVAFCSVESPKFFELSKFVNSEKGFRSMLKWLRKLLGDHGFKTCVFGFEHTGNYSYALSLFLAHEGLDMYILAPAEQKFLMGIKRGKTDPEDAKRIASVVMKNHIDMEPGQPLSPELKDLQVLFAQRKATIKERTGNKNRVLAYKELPETEIVNGVITHLEKQVIDANTRIKYFDKLIREHINKHPKLKKNAELAMSVPGVGPIITTYLLITTHNFTRFDHWRKYASYCGTAPFPHQSGSSIKGLKRVHHFANKEMKTLLFNAVGTCIQHDYELKQFYEKKIEQGKPKLWVINAIKNKILARVFAVVKRGVKYKSVDNYQKWKAAA